MSWTTTDTRIRQLTAERDQSRDEVTTLRARVVELEARAGRAEGHAAGLQQALDLADLAKRYADQTGEVERLKAQVAAGQDELRLCLVRAQQPPAQVWPNPTGVTNGR